MSWSFSPSNWWAACWLVELVELVTHCSRSQSDILSSFSRFSDSSFNNWRSPIWESLNRESPRLEARSWMRSPNWGHQKSCESKLKIYQFLSIISIIWTNICNPNSEYVSLFHKHPAKTICRQTLQSYFPPSFSLLKENLLLVLVTVTSKLLVEGVQIFVLWFYSSAS